MKTDKEFRSSVLSLLKLDSLKKEFYNIHELSVITGLSPLALKGRRKRGQIKMINEGNEILISKTEVDRFLKRLNKNI